MHKRVNKQIVYIIIFTIIIAISTVPALASDMSQWWDHEWSATKYNFGENIPFFGSFFHDNEDKILLHFYPVANWETEVCSRDLSYMSTNANKKTSQTGNGGMWFSEVTIALAASKYQFDVDKVLINIDWYVQPLDRSIKYSVYFKDSNGNKFYIKQHINISVEMNAFSAQPLPDYYDKNYDTVGIEYHTYNEQDTENPDLDDTQFVEAKIVDDVLAIYK